MVISTLVERGQYDLELSACFLSVVPVLGAVSCLLLAVCCAPHIKQMIKN